MKDWLEGAGCGLDWAEGTVDLSRGRRRNEMSEAIIWNGHLCEGAKLVPIDSSTFCLWTKCGKHDVPANSAHKGDRSEVDCPVCLSLSPPALERVR